MPAGFKPSRISTGTDDGAAAKRFLAELIEGMKAPPPEDERTIEEAVKAYLAAKYEESGHTEKGRKNIKAIEYTLRAPLRFFGDLHISQATNVQARRYVKERRKSGISDGSIRRELCFINAATRRAVSEGWANHIPAMKLPPESKTRKSSRLATAEEIALFAAAIQEKRLRLFMLLILHTFSRPAAVLELKWDRVDFKNRRIEFRDQEQAENNKRRVNIHINDALYAALKSAERERENLPTS